jgi:5-methylcytosine-specific restriction protein A
VKRLEHQFEIVSIGEAMKKKIILGSVPSRLADAKPRPLASSSWRSSKNANARGYTYEWQRYRLQFIADHPLCAIRGDGCTLAAEVVDHIAPHRGDMALFWDINDHQSACMHCHNVHKQRQEAMQRTRRS